MMKAPSPIAVVISLTAVLASIIIGCGGKSFDYNSGNEIPEGPGVLSGRQGSFTVYDSKAKAGDRQGQPTGPDPRPSAAEKTEFEEFEQWRQEKEEFEAFQRWKKSDQGAAEYREFQQWLKWREYKKWQERQQPAP